MPSSDLMGKLGKILGPKGLMPNPKNNTVLAENDIAKGVKEAKSGRVEIKLDKANIIHCVFGKASFTNEQLMENLSSIYEGIRKNRPSGAKGDFIKSATLCSSMGPGIKIDSNFLKKLSLRYPALNSLGESSKIALAKSTSRI